VLLDTKEGSVSEQSDVTDQTVPVPTAGDNPKAVPVADFVAGADRTTESIEVRISLGIIKRFSEGLYSSPNKTFEELISNAYDAGAGRVWIYLPEDLKADQAAIVVVDDGVSMDLDGLRELWMIGESQKRAREPIAGRPPIGKFGIGKLATYVLANELTYLVFRGGEYRAITMDYSLVEGVMTDPHRLQLGVATLNEAEAKATLAAASSPMVPKTPLAVTELFGAKSPTSWTAAILTSLKPPAHNIEKGRLRWVLRTAIPLNPAFRLFENDAELPSSKLSGQEVWRFTSGQDESKLPRDERIGTSENVEIGGTTAPAYRLPLAGVVRGEATLFADPLQRGKSEELGRSHGFFVRVRGRLINLEDPEFNVGPELHHGTLTRLNVVVNADDLDSLIASPRESIQESPQLREFRKYLLAIFNRARSELAASDAEDIPPLISKQGRIAEPSEALTQGPLRRMVRRAVVGDAALQEVLGLGEAELESASGLVERDDDLLEHVLVEPGGDGRIVRFDPARKAAVLNSQHPFVSNYVNVKGASEPLRLLALTDLLTQAYMLDEDVRPDQVVRIMARRDLFLRELVKRYPRSAEVVARQLRDSSNDEKSLEDAVADALSLLGFSVQRVSGNGDTDGIAVARLGRRSEGSESYSFTYDAKSSGRDAEALLGIEEEAEAESPAATSIHVAAPARPNSTSAARIRASTAQTSILRVHRQRATGVHHLDVEPEFTLLVAPGFQGDGRVGALIQDVCKNDGITPITVEDFARLVDLFPIRALTPKIFKRLMTESRSPEQSRAFVDDIEKNLNLPQTPPVAELLSVLLDYSRRKSAVTVDTLSAALYERSNAGYDIDPQTLESVVRGLAALAPRGMYFDGEIVALNSEPASLLEELHASLDRYGEGIGASFKSEVAAADKTIGAPAEVRKGPKRRTRQGKASASGRRR
jgi:hypothetical protein